MNLQKKLENLGIENSRKLDDSTIRTIAYNVTEVITKAFPYLYDEYNNILVKLLNCDMYIATVTKPISKVNYIYENSSIYFDENLNLTIVNEQMVHECVHYIQDYRTVKGRIDKIGLCNFEEFSVYGLGLNEASAQYISAKSVGNTSTILTRHGMRIRTISPNYYPFLTNLIQQIIYLIGEKQLVEATLKGSDKFENLLLNTFEGNTKKIINKFDDILNLNNSLNENQDLELVEQLQETLANLYEETQNMIFSTFFDKICPRLTTAKEVEEYNQKAINYKELTGVNLSKRFNSNNFYDVYIEEITGKFNKRLFEINKEKSRNTLSVIKLDWIGKIVKRLAYYFSGKKTTQ